MHAKQFYVVSNSDIFGLTLPKQYRYAASILNMVLLEKLDIYLYCFDLSLDLQKFTYQGHSNMNIPPWGAGGLSRECVLRIPMRVVKGD